MVADPDIDNVCSINFEPPAESPWTNAVPAQFNMALSCPNINYIFMAWSFLMATSHLTISMRGQRKTAKIQRKNCHQRNCGMSLTGETYVVRVFDLHTQDASKCQKLLSEE